MTPFIAGKSMTRSVSFMAVLVLLYSSPSPAVAVACKPKQLTQKTLRLVKPLMEARVRQAKEQEKGENWDPESPLSRSIGELLATILKDDSPAGDQAIAYLLTVYLGEQYGEDIECEVLNRGNRMLPLVKAVKACQPLTGLEPLPSPVRYTSEEALASLIGELEDGEKCDE